VIRSESSGKCYIGHTSDLAGRLRHHNDPEDKKGLYTRRNPGPWILVHEEEFLSRREAMARERFLKSGQGREWLRRKLANLANTE
jgi:putative endonuclease